MEKQEYLTIGRVAKLFGLHVQTIRRWEKNGHLKAIRSAGNHRLFSIEDIKRMIGEENNNKAVIYARVSSNKQKKDGNLDRQVERLNGYAKAHNYEVIRIFQEQASGINENRKQLHQLIKIAKNKEFSTILIEYPDRLSRFGYKYLETLFEMCDINIISTQKRELRSSQEELTEDLLTIITVFSARMYGKRSQSFKQKVTQSIEQMGSERSGE